MLGKWIQQVALSWLVYRLTGSAALLGSTTFAALIPQLLIGPLAGAWIDRYEKRKLLMMVLFLLAIQSLVLALLTAFEIIGPELILLMSLVLGVLNALDTPLRQSLISSFVRNKEDLPNALALNAMLLNGSRFIGPPLAGGLVALIGEAACFAINSLAFIAPLTALFLVASHPAKPVQGSFAKVFEEGVRYVFESVPIRTLLMSVTVINLTASSYVVLLPIFARDLFAGGAGTLGWLWGQPEEGLLSVRFSCP